MSERKVLAGDPDREAVEPMAGFDHQAWKTVVEWVGLSPEEALYVEGAEDVDRYVPGAVHTIQIKKATASATLTKVLNSIIDFWGHRQNNPHEAVHFSYLTTASRGYEKGRPFGQVKGLDLWDRGREPDVDLSTLRAFLCRELVKRKRLSSAKRESAKNEKRREGRNDLIDDLVRFLTDSSDDVVREELIRRMIWETAGAEQPELEAQAKRALVEYGDSLTDKILPRDCALVLPHLYAHVWAVARRPRGERWLRRTDWLEIFQDRTMELVPRSLARRLQVSTGETAGGSILAPPSDEAASWYATTLKGLHRAARQAFVAGNLDKAHEDLGLILAELRRERSDDPARQEFEQGVLLSLAQVAFRQADEAGADRWLREAIGLGEPSGRNRYHAGWVLLNLGRVEEALAYLDTPLPDPEWRSTRGVALVCSGDLDTYRREFGDERDSADRDVLVALVLHFTEEGDAERADFYARRLIAQGTEESVDRSRAINAACAILDLYAWSLKREPLDPVYWVDTLRRMFSDANAVMRDATPALRHSVLFRRLDFHKTLMEWEAAAEVYTELVEAWPAMAASAAAAGMGLPTDAQRDAVLAATRDPFERALIDAAIARVNGDKQAVVARLRAAEKLSDDRTRQVALVRLLEAESEAGTSLDALLPRLGEITNLESRALVHADLLANAGDATGSWAVLEGALEHAPESLRLLAAGTEIVRRLADAERLSDRDPSNLLGQELKLAERLFERLPCPEARITRAVSRARTGDAEGALIDVRAVEADGYRTRRTVSLVAELSSRLRKFGEYAAAAKRLYDDYDSSPRTGFLAAEAAIRVRDWSSAQTILRRLVSHDDIVVAARAYRALAFVVDSVGVQGAREEAVRILMEGYDRLGGPVELAGPLYFYAIGTRHGRDVHERIAHDHGSFANLPGVISMPVEEAAEMMRREEEGGQARSRMLAQAVISFETFAGLSPRRMSYLWFAHRIARRILVVDPPRFLLPAQVELFGDGGPLPLLMDRTALLMLAETGLIDAVLGSPLSFLIGRETVDWLEEEGRMLQSDYRPVEHQRLRDEMSALEAIGDVWITDRAIDEERIDALRATLTWVNAFEIALAQREGAILIDDYIDMDQVPEPSRETVVRSVDLLFALLSSGALTSYDLAAQAEREQPSAFRRAGPPKPVDLQRPVLLSSGALDAWHDTSLLPVLASAVGRLKVSPIAEHRLWNSLVEHDAHSAALTAVSQLWEMLAPAIEKGRVVLVDPLGVPEADDPAATVDRDESGNADPDGSEGRLEDILDDMLAPLVRVYTQASTAGAQVWSDDAATRLYLDFLGPMIGDAPGELRERAREMLVRHAGLRIVGTPDVLLWLEKDGILDGDQRQSLLRDLVEHGRAFVCDADLLATAARRRQDDDGVLEAVAAWPAVLDENAVKRFFTQVATTIADALHLVWAALAGDAEAQAAGTRRLLAAFSPWIATTAPSARLAARAFWLAFVKKPLADFSRDPNETVALTRTVLELASEDPARYEALLSSLWPACSALHRMAGTYPDPIRTWIAALFGVIANASQGTSVNGRSALPMEVVQLADKRFRLGIEWQVTAEGERDGRPIRIQYDSAEGTNRASRYMNDLSSTDPAALQRQVGATRTLRVTIPAKAWEDGHESSISIEVEVDLLLILDELAAPARPAALSALSAIFRTQGAPELSTLIEQYSAAVCSEEPETSAKGLDAITSAILESPRFWAEHDVYYAFDLLRQTPLDQLRAMVGTMEPWRAGDDLRTWSLRVQAGVREPGDFSSHIYQILGPYRMAANVWLALAAQGTEMASEASLRELVAGLLYGELPFQRIVLLLGAFVLIETRRDLAELPVGHIPADASGAEGIPYPGTYTDLLREVLVLLLVGESRSEETVVAKQPGAGASSAEELTPGLATTLHRHIVEMRLAATVSRLVFRSVLSESHSEEAVGAVQDGEDADPAGELLLLGQHLVTSMLRPIFMQAKERGLSRVLKEVEDAAAQSPLADGRIVEGERFVPEAIGVGPGGVNPFLSFLLHAFDTGWGVPAASPSSGEMNAPVSDLPDPPVWWSENVETALAELAVRSPSQAIDFQDHVASRAATLDRFGSLLTVGVERLAQRLLDSYSHLTERIGSLPS